VDKVDSGKFKRGQSPIQTTPFMPLLSVLIVNWNTRDLLARCLETTLASDFDEPFEVIVVDNASSDGSADMVADRFPSVRLVRSTTNTGYARGNNLAFKEAGGQFLLTLNPDTELFSDSLRRAVASLEHRRNFGVLACRLIGFDGETQKSVRGFPTIAGVLGDFLRLGMLFKRGAFDSYRLEAFEYDRAQPAPQPMGTFLLFRREALEAVGDPKSPFDETFPIFFNEVDLLYRLDRAGWPCWYDPEIRIRHLGGAGTRQVRKSMIWESHRSLLRYLRKHAVTPLTWLPFQLFSAGIWLAAFVRARGYHVGFRP
jgi:GT2 family glycosyltransferase